MRSSNASPAEGDEAQLGRRGLLTRLLGLTEAQLEVSSHSRGDGLSSSATDTAEPPLGRGGTAGPSGSARRPPSSGRRRRRPDDPASLEWMRRDLQVWGRLKPLQAG